MSNANNTPKGQLRQIKERRLHANRMLKLKKNHYKLRNRYPKQVTFFDSMEYSLVGLDAVIKMALILFCGRLTADATILFALGSKVSPDMFSYLAEVFLYVVAATIFVAACATLIQTLLRTYGVTEEVISLWPEDPFDTPLSQKYKEHGYKVRRDEGTGQYYVMSHLVNHVLYEDRWRKALSFVGEYTLPKHYADTAPYLLHHLRKERKANKTQFYNSKLIGLKSDMTTELCDQQISIMKVNYLDYLLSNELAHKICRFSYLENTKKRVRMICGEDGRLQDFAETMCADMLGGSTLAITNDGYAIMQVQARSKSIVGKAIVPSSAGSTDYGDYKLLEIKASGSPVMEDITFQQLVTETIHREMREENGYEHKDVMPADMRSKVIGLARLMKRGAKPDFLGITFVDAKAKDLYPQMNESLAGKVQILRPNKAVDQEIVNHVLIPYKENATITDAIRSAMETNPQLMGLHPSLQTGMILDLIDDYYSEGIDLFGNIQKGLSFANCHGICTPPTGEDGYGFSKEHGFAYVMDGASGLRRPGSKAADFAARDLVQSLKGELDDRLRDKNKDLQTILFESIIAIQDNHPAARSVLRDLSKSGEMGGPSSGITITRLREDGRMEYYSLGDCTLSVKYKDGSVEAYTNQDIVRLDNNVLGNMVKAVEKRAVETVREAIKLPEIQEELLANRNRKNKEDGYWVLDLSGLGIPHGTYRTFNPDIIESFVLTSDGTSDLYASHTEEEVHDWFVLDPEGAIAFLKKEYDQDPEWAKYPRFKPIDDITILSVTP